MDDTIFTKRLKLTRLRTFMEDSDDLTLFHSVWADPQATQWSRRGASKDLEASQRWMLKVLPPAGGIGYGVYRRAGSEENWEGIGVVTLLPQASTALPLPLGLRPAGDEREPKAIQLGYLYLPNAWGHGYATESSEAMLEHYRKCSERNSELTYVESIVHTQNGASIRVMEKLGFERIGGRAWGDELIFVSGDWRENRTMVFGKYL